MMKALVLAGGRGSRLQNFTENKNKSMHEFNGRPLIEYSLQNAKRADVDEIVIVVGYKAEQIINRFGNHYDGTPVKYVIQWERKGVVHAVECSQDAIGGSDFMLFLADEILIEPRHAKMFQSFTQEDLFALCGIVWVEDKEQIKKTYSIMHDDRNQRIYRLIEKPRRPFNKMMGTGNCVFRNEIFDYIPLTPINQQRGEKELPDLIQCAIDDGNLVKCFDIGGAYINVNTVDDVERLERPQ
jgi:dTDP-glucose pyrophosphorylase